jgi:outer membrane lipoprotein-sorting protein
MERPENNKWLDEALAETIGSEKPLTDFGKWKQQHPEAVKMLTSRAGRRASASLSPLTIRRLIMKSPITKLAAAAVIIIAVTLSITFFDKSVTPAYGIEQTIEAFRDVNSVYVEAITRGEANTSLNLKMWARRGEDRKFFFGDFRQESSYGDTIVANEKENLTYCYYPSTKEVYIYEGLTETIGSFLDINFFLYLQKEMKDVKMEYGKDEVTGKEIVSLSFKETERHQKSACKCGVIIFDLESKLPSRIKLWDNPDFEGDAYIVWTSIMYNPKVREDTFKFEIPEDATVIRD